MFSLIISLLDVEILWKEINKYMFMDSETG